MKKLEFYKTILEGYYPSDDLVIETECENEVAVYRKDSVSKSFVHMHAAEIASVLKLFWYVRYDETLKKCVLKVYEL